MMSDSHEQSRKNSGDNVFRGIPVAGDEALLFAQFLDGHDLAPNSRRAFAQDVRKFGQWFTTANREPLCIKRVTVRDITDFREHIRRDQGQAVATVNRCIVTLRKFFGWLADLGHIPANPGKPVKELKRQALAPNRSEQGADIQAILMSIFFTLKKRGHNPINTIYNALEIYLKTGQLPQLPAISTAND